MTNQNYHPYDPKQKRKPANPCHHCGLQVFFQQQHRLLNHKGLQWFLYYKSTGRNHYCRGLSHAELAVEFATNRVVLPLGWMKKCTNDNGHECSQCKSAREKDAVEKRQLTMVDLSALPTCASSAVRAQALVRATALVHRVKAEMNYELLLKRYILSNAKVSLLKDVSSESWERILSNLESKSAEYVMNLLLA